MPKTILIVEDHEALGYALKDWIAASFPECTCVKAASGEEAIALSAAEAPVVVLMDFELPGINGIDAVRQIKALCPAARFVVMSRHDMSELARSAEDAGAHACLAKQEMQTRLLPLLREQLAEAA